jgi:hypothetical protein
MYSHSDGFKFNLLFIMKLEILLTNLTKFINQKSQVEMNIQERKQQNVLNSFQTITSHYMQNKRT